MNTPSSDGDRALPRKRSRSVPAIYGIVSLVLVLGAVTFALSTPPPSTPPLAAVAPAPQEQLEVERIEQSSRFGEGTGGEGDCVPGTPGCAGVGEAAPVDGQEAAPADPLPADQGEPEVVETRAPADLRRCANGPGGPRQTEDPQSPPCMQEIFSGDNGGATWPGVTATEIRLALPVRDVENDDQRRTQDAIPHLLAHFNRHYELHGRTLTVVEVVFPAASRDATVQRAFAQDVAEADVFAALPFPNLGAFQEELASRGIISVMGDRGIGRYRASFPQRLHPYVWAVNPSLDETQQFVGELICRALAGRLAQHGGEDVADATRHFGLVEQRGADGRDRFPVERLVRRLEACGATHGVYTVENLGSHEELGFVLRRMRDDGVTTVVCSCERFDNGPLNAAEEIGYRPEWFLPGIDERHVELRSSKTKDKVAREQIRNVFGVDANLRAPREDQVTGARHREQFWFHAARENDQTFDPAGASHDDYYDYYASLLVLSSGIQWAGPDLTPETFGAALEPLRYPTRGWGRSRGGSPRSDSVPATTASTPTSHWSGGVTRRMRTTRPRPTTARCATWAGGPASRSTRSRRTLTTCSSTSKRAAGEHTFER